MANTSGKFSSSHCTAAGSSKERHIEVVWSATNDTANNKSTISWTAYARSTNSSTTSWVNAKNVVVTINGESKTVIGATATALYKDKSIGSGSITVSHGSDGTKSVSVGITAQIYSYGATNSSYSGTITMKQNPVYTLSISAGTGSSITVNRTSCAGVGSTGNLSAGSKKLCKGDKLKISFSPSTNYSINAHTVNIYASNGTGTGTNFANSITRVELNRARSTTTNAIITLGAIRFIADGGHDDYGRGHIHWCKLWHGDLGDTNARQLAAWYHEPLRMEYYGNNVYRLAGGSSQKTNASFICNHLLDGRLQQMNTGNTNAGGWDASKMRTFLNTRILDAIPTVWRSMLKKAKISASAGSQSTEILISEDYIYLPCVREMNNEGSSIYPSEGNYITWFTNNAKRCKFRGYVIPDDAEYYTSSSDPSTVTSNNVKPGDVWINTSNGSNGFIYVPQSVVDQYALVAVSGNLSAEIIAASIGGAWVRTNWWWLRSPNVSNSTSFWVVATNGTCGNGNASNSGGVCPCFSI